MFAEGAVAEILTPPAMTQATPLPVAMAADASLLAIPPRPRPDPARSASAMSSGAVPAGTSRGSLAVIELDEPWAQRDLKVCVRKRESLSGFSAALLACLVGEG